VIQPPDICPFTVSYEETQKGCVNKQNDEKDTQPCYILYTFTPDDIEYAAEPQLHSAICRNSSNHKARDETEQRTIPMNLTPSANI